MGLQQDKPSELSQPSILKHAENQSSNNTKNQIDLKTASEAYKGFQIINL